MAWGPRGVGRPSTPILLGGMSAAQGSTESPYLCSCCVSSYGQALSAWFGRSALLPPFVLAALRAFLCWCCRSLPGPRSLPPGHAPTPSEFLCTFCCLRLCYRLDFGHITVGQPRGHPLPLAHRPRVVCQPLWPLLAPPFASSPPPHLLATSPETLSSCHHEHPPQRETFVGWGSPIWHRSPLWRQSLLSHAHGRIVGRGGCLPRAPRWQ